MTSPVTKFRHIVAELDEVITIIFRYGWHQLCRCFIHEIGNCGKGVSLVFKVANNTR